MVSPRPSVASSAQIEGIMHTNGTWFIVENPDARDGSNAASIYGGDTYVADVYCGYVGSENIGKEEQKANARLISAAPDLLAALEHCLLEHGGYTIKGETERMAKAAIAKAKSGASA